MLKVPDHQVAGHFATDGQLGPLVDGQLGPLVDGSGLFFKPLQSSSRGDTELSFYTSFCSDPRIPSDLRSRFFPSFHGTRLLPHTAGEVPHLILEDLTADFSSPSIIDFKIGARTWSPADPEPYFQKCIKKDRETTSLALGFRVSGLQLLAVGGSSLVRPVRDEVRKYGVDDVRRVMREFVAVMPVKEAERAVGLMRELKDWFERQIIWHFYSASVMVMYEEVKGEARVKLVDFAHVVEGNGVIDHNFLGGLCSLIRFMEEAIEGLVGGKEEDGDIAAS